MSWQHTATHIVANCPDYRVDLEEHRDDEGRQMLFAHITVFTISPVVLKRLRAQYALFRECVSAPLYAIAGEQDDDKWERFISRFGFKYLMDVVCENGKTRRLFVSISRANKQEEHERSILTEPSHRPDAGY